MNNPFVVNNIIIKYEKCSNYLRHLRVNGMWYPCVCLRESPMVPLEAPV